MYDDIVDLAMDSQLLCELNPDSDDIEYKSLPIWKELADIGEEQLISFENKLLQSGNLVFDAVFNEELGYYFISAYLESEDSVDKAVFIKDVEHYRSINHYNIRKKLALKIYNHFCQPKNFDRITGTSCITNQGIPDDKHLMSFNTEMSVALSTFSCNESVHSHLTELSNYYQCASSYINCDEISEIPFRSDIINNQSVAPHMSPQINSINLKSTNATDNVTADDANDDADSTMSSPTITVSTLSSFFADTSNVIGVYGKKLKRLRRGLDLQRCDKNIFNGIYHEIRNDLKLDVFPRFIQSPLFRMYLKCKCIENNSINDNSFKKLRMLGHGAFGSVSACKKISTGKIYAMKQIDKRRVQATDSIDALIDERNFLSQMDSLFVTSLKYSYTDDDTLYLIMDLMTGGDLKYHLNHAGVFEEKRARFYAAQILLGLQHIHSKGIIYRDLKLENILVDKNGHCKLSDLGLAVSINDGLVRGYAGTPGYTAPEVVLTQYYDYQIDFFSFGVVIYRFLCGKKPFLRNKKTITSLSPQNHNKNNKKIKFTKQTSSIKLDRNVVEMTPNFSQNIKFSIYSKNLIKSLLLKNSKNRLGNNGYDEIKQHPWFDCIDWSLLEIGYLKSPFIPPSNQINAERNQFIGKPPNDDKYSKINITDKFNNSLKTLPFSFKSSKVIQSEIVEILKNIETKDLYNLPKLAAGKKGKKGTKNIGKINQKNNNCLNTNCILL